MSDEPQSKTAEELQAMIDEQNKVISDLRTELDQLRHENASLMLKVSVDESKPEPEEEDETFEDIVQEAIDKAMEQYRR